jgi:hypothetical protein
MAHPRNKRNEEKWFPSEKSTVLPALPILQDLSPPVSAGGMRKSGSVENKMRRTRATLISWRPARRPPREGMRKTGSPENSALQSPRTVALLFPGRTDIEGDEEKWFRKKPTKKSLFVTEYEVLRRSQGSGRFRERPKS